MSSEKLQDTSWTLSKLFYSNRPDWTYLGVLKAIVEHGDKRDDRTGVGTISVFGANFTFEVDKYFPILKSKKMNFKSILSELLWFIEGSTDERRLAEIRYGKPREELVDKTTIWTENAKDPKWLPKAKFDGDLGDVYGRQWRKWAKYTPDGNGNYTVSYIDQLAELVEGIKNNPYSRRHILSAWNVAELDNMALPPCHMTSQFYVSEGKLSCKLTQRSGDFFLGVPYNISSYSLLLIIIAHLTGLKPHLFTMDLGDAHVYLNHLDQVNEQLNRRLLMHEYKSLPQVIIDPSVKSLDDLSMDNIKLIGYEPMSEIKAPMAV